MPQGIRYFISMLKRFFLLPFPLCSSLHHTSKVAGIGCRAQLLWTQMVAFLFTFTKSGSWGQVEEPPLSLTVLLPTLSVCVDSQGAQFHPSKSYCCELAQPGLGQRCFGPVTSLSAPGQTPGHRPSIALDMLREVKGPKHQTL